MEEPRFIRDVVESLDSEPDSVGLVVEAEIPIEVVADFVAEEWAPAVPQRIFVQSGGQVIGFVPGGFFRSLEHREEGRRLLAGDPASQSSYFVCPERDWLERVDEYDFDAPPRCPNHDLVLERWHA